MKAIQITAPSEMKEVYIEKPVLEPGEVLVKIKYIGFCGSDLNTFLGDVYKRQGNTSTRPPRILLAAYILICFSLFY